MKRLNFSGKTGIDMINKMLGNIQSSLIFVAFNISKI